MISKGRHKECVPRDNKKFNHLCHNMDDIYKSFVKEYPNIKVDNKTFKNILKDLNLLIVDSIVEGETFNFPLVSDNIHVRKVKMNFKGTTKEEVSKRLPFDFHRSLKDKKDTRFINVHSDFFLCKIRWVRPRGGSARDGGNFKKYYSFVPCRAFKLKVSRQVQKPGGHKIYFENK